MVIVGAVAGFTMVRENGLGPPDPARFVAFIDSELMAAISGVPVNSPDDERLAQAGNPIPLQVIGAVPVAVNW